MPLLGLRPTLEALHMSSIQYTVRNGGVLGGLWFTFGFSAIAIHNQYLMSEVVTLRDRLNCTPTHLSTPKEPQVLRLAHLVGKSSPRHKPTRSGMIIKHPSSSFTFHLPLRHPAKALEEHAIRPLDPTNHYLHFF